MPNTTETVSKQRRYSDLLAAVRAERGAVCEACGVPAWLVAARGMEIDRKIVFPETTVIVRDIERLLGKVRAKEEGGAPEQDRDAPPELLPGRERSALAGVRSMADVARELQSERGG